jgi:hypothetical protein
MPVQKAKSGLAARLGAKGQKAHEAHKGDEVTYSGGASLPPGIEGGVAQLVDCKFDIFKTGDFAGEYYFFAAGVVKQPKEHAGINIFGQRTQIGPEPLCETPGRSRQSIDEHLAWVYNELRKLGINTEEIGFDDLESVVAALKEAGPHFRFRTWQGQATKEFPNPRTNHDWRGSCDYVGDDDDGVSEDAEPSKDAEEIPDVAEGEDSTESAEDIDLDALAAEADGGDEEAQIKITGQAKLFNVDHEAYSTWAEVAEAIKESSAGDEKTEEEEAEEEEPAEFKPTKGDVYFYKPVTVDAKTKKKIKSKKSVECEVTAVFEKNKTVNIKNLDDGRTSYKGVSWNDLEQE